MHDNAKIYPKSLMITVLAGLCLLLTVAAFVGWIVQGPEMFLTMAENGLSWCF